MPVVWSVRYATQALIGVAVMLTLMATDRFYRAVIERMILRLADIGIGGTRLTPSVHPLRFLHAANETIKRALVSGIAWAEGFVVSSLNELVDFLGIVFGIFVLLGMGLALAVKTLAHRLDHAAHSSVVTNIHKTITRSVTVVRGVSKAQFRTLQHELEALRARVKHAAIAAPGAIALPWPRLGRLEKRVEALARERLNTRRWLGYASLAALAVAILTKAGVNWVRCRNVRRVGKRICGLDPDLLGTLLASTLLITGRVSIQDVARELEEPTQLVRDSLKYLVREMDIGDAPRAGGA